MFKNFFTKTGKVAFATNSQRSCKQKLFKISGNSLNSNLLNSKVQYSFSSHMIESQRM